MRLAGADITENLANRIIAEIEADDLNFEHQMQRLEASITATRRQLHPILLEYLNGNE